MRHDILVGCALAVASTSAAGAPGGESGDQPANLERETPASKDQVADESKKKKPSPSSTVFWIDSGVGWEHVALTTLRVARNSGGDAVIGELWPAGLSGPALGLGVGVRWLVLSLGIRATAAFFSDPSPDRTGDGSSQLYSVDAELGLRIPAGRVEPHILFGAGYSAFGGLGSALRGLGRGLDIDGANLRLGFGLDYFLTRTLSIGARVTGEILFLARPGVALRDLIKAESVSTLNEARARLLEGEDSSAGTAVVVTVGPALHF